MIQREGARGTRQCKVVHHDDLKMCYARENSLRTSVSPLVPEVIDPPSVSRSASPASNVDPDEPVLAGSDEDADTNSVTSATSAPDANSPFPQTSKAGRRGKRVSRAPKRFGQWVYFVYED